MRHSIALMTVQVHAYNVTLNNYTHDCDVWDCVTECYYFYTPILVHVYNYSYTLFTTYVPHCPFTPY